MSRSNPTFLERIKAEVYMALNGSEAPDHYDDGVHAHHDQVIRNYGRKVVHGGQRGPSNPGPSRTRAKTAK